MIELILMTIMALSVAGMILTGIDDPLSRKFWDDIRRK